MTKIVLVILLLAIIVVVAIMGSYKIETFASPPEAQMYPQTPDDLSCYSYIKNVKGWNVDDMSDSQKKVVFSMRALQGHQYVTDSKVFPYKNACVIPKEHFPIFNKQVNDATPLKLTLASGQQTVLNYTDQGDTPEGVYVDLSAVDFDGFKGVLDALYQLYDEEFINEKKFLETLVDKLTKQRDDLNTQLEGLKQQTKQYQDDLNKLLDPNGECGKAQQQAMNMQESIGKYTQQNADLQAKTNQLQALIDDGNSKLQLLASC